MHGTYCLMKDMVRKANKLTVSFFFFFMSIDPPGPSLSSTGKHNLFFFSTLIYCVLHTDDKIFWVPEIVWLFSCQTPLCLPWPIIFDVYHWVPKCGRGPLLSKQAPTPPTVQPFSWVLYWREKGKRAALKRNNSTVRRCQALGAVRWMMIWVRWCCCFSLCWMLTHGPQVAGRRPTVWSGPRW